MNDESRQYSAAAETSGLVLGMILGATLGPIFFVSHGVSAPVAAAAGSLVGALLGFGAVALALLARRWQRDYELQLAAEAVRREAALPRTIDIKVKKGVVMLEGEVADYAERHRIEQALSTVPGIKGVTNHLRLRPSNGTLATSPDDIRRRIQDTFVQQAEREGQEIRVLLNDSHIVLEGTVRSSAEASEAEEVAWHIPGVVKVENRLEVAG
jgi:hypothetical protein